MDYFEAVAKRRSVRRFRDEPVPEPVVRKALAAAVLAPNSSNAQTWDFYWVRTPEKKSELVRCCLDQSAARTARELVVVVASPKAWRRSWLELRKWVRDVQAPEPVRFYYDRLFPALYRWGPFNILGLGKWLALNAAGLFRPMMRGPFSRRAIQEVAIKSAALAAENFVLAVSAQGYASCMMEGFDEWRVKRLLGLKRSDRIVMVIGIGREGERGTWGPQFRLPLEKVVHEL